MARPKKNATSTEMQPETQNQSQEIQANSERTPAMDSNTPNMFSTLPQSNPTNVQVISSVQPQPNPINTMGTITDVTPTPVVTPQQTPTQAIPQNIVNTAATPQNPVFNPTQTITTPIQPVQPVAQPAPIMFPQQPPVIQHVQPVAQTMPTIPEMPTSSHQNTMVSLDDDIKLKILEKFPELRKEENARIALMVFNEKGSPNLQMAYHFYKELSKDEKFGFKAPANKELLNRIMQLLGEPKLRFGTIALKYYTDPAGRILQNALGTFDYSLYAFTFSTDKYPVLKQMQQKWGLANHDIAVTCKDADFQKWNMVPEPDCYWKGHPNAAEIYQEAQTLFETSLKKYMPREVPDNEIEVKLGFKKPDVATSVNPNMPFSPQGQLMQQVGGTAHNAAFAGFVIPTTPK
ncbi:MAG: hypothetical protein WC511_01665 [Candidatus Pacearchaeota archaeon]